MIEADSWDRLQATAKADHLRLYITPHGVTIYTTSLIEQPMISIQVHDIDRDDEVLRAMTSKALRLLKSLHND